MSTLVNRTGWCIIRRNCVPCVVVGQDLATATATVIVDGRREVISAYQFTTNQDTANEWRQEFCTWCHGTGTQDAGGEMVPCPHCR